MSYPDDPPVQPGTFDYRNPAQLAAMYQWAGSAGKLAAYLRSQGVVLSENTITNWCRRYGIAVANPAYAARKGARVAFEVPEAVAESEAEPQPDYVAGLLEYLQHRTIPDPRELVCSAVSGKGIASAVVAGDFHMPWHHQGAFNLFKCLVSEWQPDLVILNGDFHDFTALSRFAKRPDALTPMQQLLSEGRRMMAEIQAATGAQVVFVPGNHEENRLLNYLWTQAPALSSLDVLRLEALLGLAEMGIGYAPDGVELTPELVVMHGDRFTNALGGGSAMSARKEGLDLGVSSVTNHTHKGGLFLRKDRRGYRANAEGFCMCDQEKMRAAGVTRQKRGGKVEDWQLGVTRVDFKVGGEAFCIQPVPILEGRGRVFAIIQGKEISTPEVAA